RRAPARRARGDRAPERAPGRSTAGGDTPQAGRPAGRGERARPADPDAPLTTGPRRDDRHHHRNRLAGAERIPPRRTDPKRPPLGRHHRPRRPGKVRGSARGSIVPQECQYRAGWWNHPKPLSWSGVGDVKISAPGRVPGGLPPGTDRAVGTQRRSVSSATPQPAAGGFVVSTRRLSIPEPPPDHSPQSPAAN